jgi:hypothetical protein
VAATAGLAAARGPGSQGWHLREYEGRDAELPLDALSVSLPLAELYEGVELPPPPAA